MSYSADEIRSHIEMAMMEAREMLEEAQQELADVESELDNSGF
jgi:F0F1-type ATP synthase membrane subunit b/b'|tara:strand:+ start:404 stop:532 length:129 start_codon:yes stop_codon:yes gene_type:complete